MSKEVCMCAQVDISPRFQSVVQRGEVGGGAVEVTANESRAWGQIVKLQKDSIKKVIGAKCRRWISVPIRPELDDANR